MRTTSMRTTSRTSLLMTTLAAAVTLAGCGNGVTTEVRGIVGLTADSSGAAVILLSPCGASLDRITISGLVDGPADPRPRQPSHRCLLCRERPRSPPRDPPGAPQPPWTVTKAVDPLQVTGGSPPAPGSSTADQAATSVLVSRAALDSLDAGHVVVREGESWTRAEFDARACSPQSWPTTGG
ncbi:MAG: hypothetical protein IPH03_14155 [Tetrasphaera sp.]|nr:hypothetical protein [Tetrasphaera sp.]